MNKHILKYFFAGAAVMLLSACNGVMSGLYDDADDSTTSEFGFIESATETVSGKIYIDASSYTDWTYINFHNMQTATVSVNDAAPSSWDLAIHRYDAKTNGGSVAEINSDEYVSDVWTTSKIVTDMSTMMDGYLNYVESDYNDLLSSWLNVDTSSMPPSYSLSNKTYILKMQDGTKASLKLINFMNASGVKGFMTIEYNYPIK